ncbi:hypothetical protein ASPCAL00894 [Aspergillus calidoustus]|uniref:RING-type domain-containing protein n=1 Tax=Aspergillus calidoustus TaxID=454130 RepID=A0A0U5C1S4_ASPCI|nr:hypothetical protein ASPCAL00894 [Aspergillus calidoustus]
MPVPVIVIFLCFCFLYIIAMTWLLYSDPGPQTSLDSTPQGRSVESLTQAEVEARIARLNRETLRIRLRDCPGLKPTETTQLKDPVQPSAVICPICLDQIRPNDLVYSLSCRHVFHEGCLQYWYLYENNRCPLCQRAIIPSGESPAGAQSVVSV